MAVGTGRPPALLPPPPPLKCWPITVVSAPKERASERASPLPSPPSSSISFSFCLSAPSSTSSPQCCLARSVSAAPLNGRGEGGPFASQVPGLAQRVPVLFHLSPRGSWRVRSRSPPRRRRRPTWQALERGSQVNLNVRSMDRLRSTDEKKVARMWSGTAFKVHSAPCQQSNSGTIQKDRSLGRSVGVSGGLIFTLAAAPRSARSPISARSTVVRSWLLLNKRRPNAS